MYYGNKGQRVKVKVLKTLDNHSLIEFKNGTKQCTTTTSLHEKAY